MFFTKNFRFKLGILFYGWLFYEVRLHWKLIKFISPKRVTNVWAFKIKIILKFIGKFKVSIIWPIQILSDQEVSYFLILYIICFVEYLFVFNLKTSPAKETVLFIYSFIIFFSKEFCIWSYLVPKPEPDPFIGVS